MSEPTDPPADDGEEAEKITRKRDETGKDPSALVQLAEEIDVPSPAIQKMFEMGFAAMGPAMQRYHPVFDKFNDQHVDKFLDYIQRDDDHAYELQKSGRWINLIYVLLFVALLVFLVIYLLPTNKDLLTDLFKMAVSFLGGLGSGFGLKAHLDKKK